MKTMNNQKGFTLIELVVVIVILGILAATAAPKFIDLQDDARTATLNAVKASMQSASTLVHSKSLIEGNQNDAAATTVEVQVNGAALDINYGYPLEDYSGVDGSWDALLDFGNDDFSGAFISGSGYVVVPGDTAPTALPSECYVTYEDAADADTPPVITVVDC